MYLLVCVLAHVDNVEETGLYPITPLPSGILSISLREKHCA